MAAQRVRRGLDDLIHHTPADGIVTGIGSVNGKLFSKDVARVGVLAYDYTVLAGTQGGHGHLKTDRILDVCERQRLPIVFFCEGGGGRPGDTDFPASGAGLCCPTFVAFARMSGLVPLIGIVSGYCFAGNAALLGTCDVIIATKGCNIGMGGPAMIEGGGLGVVNAKDIGPTGVQTDNGVIDILVDSEAEAVLVAKQYLSYFQGQVQSYTSSNQKTLRGVVPENRLRVYNMCEVIDTIADEGSVLYLRPQFGMGMHTAFCRIAGRPVGILANNPGHLGGAIDSDAALKASRFLELCDSFDIAVLNCVDCPGFMVGLESEASASVRKMSRMFVVGASLSVPYFTLVIRKSYGLGAQAMSAGMMMGGASFCVSWPTGEFGGMGLEGAVVLGYKKELVRTLP